MTLWRYKRKKIGGGVSVKVDKHFYYSDFGVRDYDEPGRYGRRYVCAGTPGTGFIERESESSSYHDYVNSYPSLHPSTYWDLLFDREPNYDREIERAGKLLATVTDPYKRELVDCYCNALTVGRIEEEIQRIIVAVKHKIKRHSSKHLVSVVSHFKHKINLLERDMKAVQYHVKDHYTPEVYEAYKQVIDAFVAMTTRCRRIWHHNERVDGNFAQVFFDMGVFDFIRNDDFLPIMRDSLGVCYYLLPDAVIVARSSVDFDLVPLKTLTMVCQETAIEETTDLLSSRVGDAACMILVPELNLTFYFNHAHVVVDFVRRIYELKKKL